MCESTRAKLSAIGKARGDPFKTNRGGNGRGMSQCEQLLTNVLAPGWTWNYIVKTKVLKERGTPGLPDHYKVDFAWSDRMTCLEVDGSSHNTQAGKAQTLKKTAALEALGWIVLRISNAEVLSRYGTSK